MNGSGYGWFSGIMGANVNKREFAHHYNPPEWARDWKPEQQQRQREGLYENGSDHRGQRAHQNQLAVEMNSRRPASEQQQHRPHSAGSSSYGRRPQQMSRSHDNIVAVSRPLTKQVDALLYEFPQNKFSKNALCQPPEFLKVFGDIRCAEGDKAVFDCVLFGSPRPRVCWLFNDEKMLFDDVLLEDTSDICRCTIKFVRPYHYGVYTVLAENEVGRAITTATLLPLGHNHF